MKYSVVYYNSPEHQFPGEQIFWPADSNVEQVQKKVDEARKAGMTNARLRPAASMCAVAHYKEATACQGN